VQELRELEKSIDVSPKFLLNESIKKSSQIFSKQTEHAIRDREKASSFRDREKASSFRDREKISSFRDREKASSFRDLKPLNSPPPEYSLSNKNALRFREPEEHSLRVVVAEEEDQAEAEEVPVIGSGFLIRLSQLPLQNQTDLKSEQEAPDYQNEEFEQAESI